MNPPIPEKLAERFYHHANGYSINRRNMVLDMREYRGRHEDGPDFSVMQMYRDFAALTGKTDGAKQLSHRTLRYLYESTEGLTGEAWDLFMEGVVTFEHCATDKALINKAGIQRGQSIIWAARDFIRDGRAVADPDAVWLHFAPDHDKTPDQIRLLKWQGFVKRFDTIELPRNGIVSDAWREEVAHHISELKRLAESVKIS